MISIVSDLLPPVLARWVKVLSGKYSFRYQGSFSGWSDAERKAKGYSDAEILKKVCSSASAVREGGARYERDSILFSNLDHPYFIVAALLRQFIRSDNKVNVVDFGGALGSTYYQCRDFLGSNVQYAWRVVEQPAFVQCGLNGFEVERLTFHNTLEDAFDESATNVLIFSSVLQYLPDCTGVLGSDLLQKFKAIIVDRTPCSDSDKDVISVQVNGKTARRSSYPVRIFSEENLRSSLIKIAPIVAESLGHEPLIKFAGANVLHKGFLLESL